MVKSVLSKVERDRIKKAAKETDALRTPSTPGWDSTDEIRRWREARKPQNLNSQEN
jgi:hypothetical protein